MIQHGWKYRWTLGAVRCAASLLVFICCIGAALPAIGSNLKISTGTAKRLAAEVEADYTTSHIFIDEVAKGSVPITVFFDPGTLGVESAEVFTNLNRRDRAAVDADGDGIEDGIKPPSGNLIAAGDDRHYYKAYKMKSVPGGYQLTLNATKCGAYRLTARYRLNGDTPGTYHWYGDDTNTEGILKRDHAIVATPSRARNLRLYEVNPLIITATGTAPNQRGTLSDLVHGLPAGSGPRFSLSYLKHLGVNAAWLQPVHPRGIVGRQIDPSTNQPFDLGSPYSVKNFFAVMPLLAKSVAAGSTPAEDDTAAGRAQAMTDFHDFVRAADKAGVDVVVDTPFNHTAPDVELGSAGQPYWGNNSTNAETEIRSVEARVFSRDAAYDMRAFDASSIAAAPDRFDFGKWSDVFDIYFGRYSALVANANQSDNYRDEGDWFDYSIGREDGGGNGNGHFDGITQKVWRYFGDYLQFWLTQTGYPANASGKALNSTAGIDGLRADFGQGLPPQCWEYLINRTRARKWNFVFMAESLDGGAVTYRSARHFDILNERIIYDLHHATDAGALRGLYNDRRASYGAALVLLNTVSHDEDSYKDPYEGLLRFAVNSTMDGVTMIFPGQELGLRGTIIPPNDSDAAAGPPFGYDRYETPFFGKPIPAFKTYNSMMPLWQQNPNNGDTEHLLNLYAAINTARAASPALRSANRVFLDVKNGAPNEKIFGVAKFERRNAAPNSKDVVFAFVNLTVDADEETDQGNWFNVDLDADHDGVNDFGIKPDRLYNVKNIAAYTGIDANRRGNWVWPAPRAGSDLLDKGIFVRLNRVPAQESGWSSAPYEPQYLKLFDVTASQ